MRRALLLSALAGLALALTAGCRTPAAAPSGPLVGGARHTAPIVPDALDHAAADLAVAALAGNRAQVDGALDALEHAEREHLASGEPTGLVPAGIEAADAVRAPGRAGIEATERLLERDDLDAASRARLERWLADDPLALASERIFDARFIAVARLFNAVSEPVGTSILNPIMLPYTLGNALAHYSIDFVQEDTLPLQRRQALAHWQRFRRQYPDAPEVAELAPKIDAYQRDWHETQHDRALERADDALGDGRPEAALLYAARARRHADSDDAREVTQEAEAQIEARGRAYARALRFDAVAPDQLPRNDELLFVRATAAGRAGDDDAMWEALGELADTPESPMARHAETLLADPVRHPHAAFERARGAERWRTAVWVAVGPLAARPEESGALGAFEYLLNLPWRLQAAALLPIRLLQLPWREPTPGDTATAVHARRYLEIAPAGAHAAELRDWLEGFERDRENWVGALRVAEGRPVATTPRSTRCASGPPSRRCASRRRSSAATCARAC